MAYRPGGIIHSYQKYDPASFPSPTQPPPDLVSPAFEHALMYGGYRELTEEELARAIKLDPTQIAGMGPSLDMLRAMLLERKRKILETYETRGVEKKARKALFGAVKKVRVPKELQQRFDNAVRQEQPYEVERIWYRAGDDNGPLAQGLLQVHERMVEKHQIQELVTKYAFTGAQSMTVPEALEVKEELENIDQLLKQIEEAAKTAQIGIIDMDLMSEFAEPGDMQRLEELQRQVENMRRQMPGVEYSGSSGSIRFASPIAPLAFRQARSTDLTEAVRSPGKTVPRSEGQGTGQRQPGAMPRARWA